MDRKTFKTLIINPLNKEFNTIIYFNGKLAQSKNLYLPASTSGIAYINRKNKPIVISWQRNYHDSLQTIFHEIGHITLHGKGSNFKSGRIMEELEAEMVAKITCELLNLSYNPFFKVDREINFIENYTKFKPKKVEPRIELINKIAERIYNVLKDIKI